MSTNSNIFGLKKREEFPEGLVEEIKEEIREFDNYLMKLEDISPELARQEFNI